MTIFASKNNNNMEKSFYSDIEIISAINDGYQGATNWFYAKSRIPFIKHVSIKIQDIHQFASDEHYYCEELFHESLDRFLIKVKENKLFVKDGTILYINKQGEETILKGTLQNLLMSIGDNILKELIRKNGGEDKEEKDDNEESGLDPYIGLHNQSKKKRTFVRLDDYLRKMESDENEDNSDSDMNENGPSIGISSETDGEDNDYEDTPFCDIPDPDEDEDTNKIHTSVRYIVANMGEPCKSIFKYKFFTEDGKRMHDDEIASLTGLKNATTVRSTFQNCKKKFKERFEKILKYLS